ncbi:hypothetical protein L915_05521, partial [Phytophthora nicotianae]
MQCCSCGRPSVVSDDGVKERCGKTRNKYSQVKGLHALG